MVYQWNIPLLMLINQLHLVVPHDEINGPKVSLSQTCQGKIDIKHICCENQAGIVEES